MRILKSSIHIGLRFGNNAKILNDEDFQILCISNVIFPNCQRVQEFDHQMYSKTQEEGHTNLYLNIF